MEYPIFILDERFDSGITASVYKFTEKKERTYSTHTLIYVLKGSLSCNYKASNLTLKEKDLLFVSANEAINYESKNAYAVLFFIPEDALMGYKANISLTSAFGEDTVFDEIRHILNQMIISQYYSDTYFEIKLQSLCKELIHSLLAGFCKESEINEKSNRTFAKLGTKERKSKEFSEILDLVDKNYASPLKLGELAALYYYSPSQLSKLFIKFTGLHFSEYLSNLRLSKASVYLLQSNLEISTISDKVGFPNPRAFSRDFEKKYGVKPSKYRNSHDNAENKAGFNLGSGLKYLKEKGILDIVFCDLSSKSHTEHKNALTHTIAKEHLGSFSFKENHDIFLSDQNSVLNIYRAKDLLLDEIKQKVIILQEEIAFKYLNCHGLLDDDMQICFEDSLNIYGDGEDKILFDFSLPEKAVRFAKEAGLTFIFHLSYMPSFLTKEKDKSSSFPHHARMPASMSLWNRYLNEFFNHMIKKFGNYIYDCPVLLWQIPDIITDRFDMVSRDDYNKLYLNTYKSIKAINPAISVQSPMVTCSMSGLNFLKDFLRFCKENSCVPDAINTCFTLSDTLKKSENFLGIMPVECRSFAMEIKSYLKTLSLDSDMPINMPEYYYSFGVNTACDSMIGAVLPLIVLLQNHHFYNNFGYWAGCDFTTETVYGKSQFCGGRGLFSIVGGKKSSFFALKYISKLGNKLLGAGDGYVITKDGDTIKMILFYAIAENKWHSDFNEENALSFFEDFPKKRLSLNISDFAFKEALIYEEYLNYEEGSAYERWLKDGGRLLESLKIESDIYDSVPSHKITKSKTKEDTLSYECLLLPFEIRYVEIIPT